jgi:hypothetical protein
MRSFAFGIQLHPGADVSPRGPEGCPWPDLPIQIDTTFVRPNPPGLITRGVWWSLAVNLHCCFKKPAPPAVM